MPNATVQSFEFTPKGQKGSIPKVGLGTATLKGDVCETAVKNAVDAGYRMIDTALLYGNQEEVGRAIAACGVSRDELFVTSKVAFFPPHSEGVWMHDSNNVKGDERASIELSLKQLGLKQVDLMLIHNPCAGRAEYNAACMPHFFELFNSEKNRNEELAIKPSKLPDGQDLRTLLLRARRDDAQSLSDPTDQRRIREASWKALEAAQRDGLCKYIGVSNYPVELLREMEEYATVMPAVNQLELHPRFSSPELRRAASEMGVVLTGYGTGNAVLMERSPVVAAIASRLGRTAVQVVTRWTIQSGVVAIPRSASKEHISQNLGVLDFELSAEDMQAINALNEDHPYYWDPVATVMARSGQKRGLNGEKK